LKERPILMKCAMVRAILEGRKTQTRRIIQPQPSPCGLRRLTGGDISATGLDASYWYGSDPFTEARKCPYGVPGDQLWVRETFAPHSIGDGGIAYRADGPEWDDECGIEWRPSIFMPRLASRITLEIEAVRVERLIEISEEDAMADGVVYRDSCWFATDDPKGLPWMTASGAYRELWESINGPGSWDANPWVWVIQFRRITP